MAPTQRKILSMFLVNAILLLICALWTIPTVGLLVSSFRPRDEVLSTAWWKTNPTSFTLANYEQVLGGKEYPDPSLPGGVAKGQNMLNSFLNSVTVTIPATLIPILIAAFAAYAFAWMNFPGR